jgi:phosphoribosylformimino-5-aminoimidazole carboxamide ribotide isomerase
MTFTVYPAIDVRDGRVVRLHQGDYDRETRYDDAPLAWMQRHAAEGATWTHLVDLDAARDGGYTLLPLLRAIKRETPLRVQTGGGIRSADDVMRLLEAGADRVVVGSLAVEDPDLVASWLRQFGSERIVVALDARCDIEGRWVPATRGWLRQGSRTLESLVRRHAEAGMRHLLCTDIARDGTLSGPNLALYASLRRWASGVDLQASGGARDAGDVQRVRELGCSGIVLGKSLLEGRIALAGVLAC